MEIAEEDGNSDSRIIKAPISVKKSFIGGRLQQKIDEVAPEQIELQLESKEEEIIVEQSYVNQSVRELFAEYENSNQENIGQTSESKINNFNRLFSAISSLVQNCIANINHEEQRKTLREDLIDNGLFKILRSSFTAVQDNTDAYLENFEKVHRVFRDYILKKETESGNNLYSHLFVAQQSTSLNSMKDVFCNIMVQFGPVAVLFVKKIISWDIMGKNEIYLEKVLDWIGKNRVKTEIDFQFKSHN